MGNMRKNVIISVLYQLLKIIVPIVTAPYIARVLGSDQIGVYSYTSSIVAYFAIFAGLGTASYGAREVARHRTDRRSVSKIFWEIEILTIFSSAIVLTVWVVWVVCNPQYRNVYLVLSLNILSITLDISWLYNGLEQFKYEITINSLIKVLGVLSIFALVKRSDDLIYYVVINSLSTLLGSLSLWLSAHKFIDVVPIRLHDVFSHFRKTFMYFLPTIAGSLYSYLDKTLIGLITQSYSENGYYEQATKVITLCNSLTFFPINSVVQSRNSYLYAKEKNDEIKNTMKISMSGCLYMGIGICFGLCSIADLFVQVFFGMGYAPVISILYVFAPLILLTGIGAVYSFQYYNPAGKINYVTICMTICTVLNIGMNIILIPNYGAVGAAVASVISELIVVILYILNCNGYYSIILLIKSGYKKCIGGFIMFFCLTLLKEQIENQLLSLIICILFGAVMFTIVLILLKDDFVYEYLWKSISKKKRINNLFGNKY